MGAWVGHFWRIAVEIWTLISSTEFMSDNVAERSKARGSGPRLARGVGSNPTVVIRFYLTVARFSSPFLSSQERLHLCTRSPRPLSSFLVCDFWRFLITTRAAVYVFFLVSSSLPRFRVSSSCPSLLLFLLLSVNRYTLDVRICWSYLRRGNASDERVSLWDFLKIVRTV